MKTQARKLVLMEGFLHISDENIITKLESFIKQEKKISHKESLKPMSLKDFHEMTDQAKPDSDAGRIISHQELKKKVKTWKIWLPLPPSLTVDKIRIKLRKSDQAIYSASNCVSKSKGLQNFNL